MFTIRSANELERLRELLHKLENSDFEYPIDIFLADGEARAMSSNENERGIRTYMVSEKTAISLCKVDLQVLRDRWQDEDPDVDLIIQALEELVKDKPEHAEIPFREDELSGPITMKRVLREMKEGTELGLQAYKGLVRLTIDLMVRGKLETSAIKNARATMHDAFEDDAGFKQSYIANIAMLLYDNSKLSHEESNILSPMLLKLIFD